MFQATRPSSGAIEYIISFTNAAYGVLGVARCLEERAHAAFVKEIIYSIAPEDGRVA